MISGGIKKRCPLGGGHDRKASLGSYVILRRSRRIQKSFTS